MVISNKILHNLQYYNKKQGNFSFSKEEPFYFLVSKNNKNIINLFTTTKNVKDYTKEELYLLKIILSQNDIMFTKIINQYTKQQINNMISVLLNVKDINVQKKIFYFYRILYFLENLEYSITYLSKFIKNNLEKFINQHNKYNKQVDRKSVV